MPFNDTPEALPFPISSTTGQLALAEQVVQSDDLNFVSAVAKVAAANLATLDSNLNRNRVVRLDGNGSFIAGLSPEVQAAIDAMIVTRGSTGSLPNDEPIWYTAQSPSQDVLNTFVATPTDSDQWVKIENEDGIPPVSGVETTYTVVVQQSAVIDGVLDGSGTTGSIVTEFTNATLPGYHVYELVVPGGDPLVPSNFVIFVGGVAMYAATGLSETVQVALDNLRNINFNTNSHLDSLLSTLFGGASVSVDHSAATVVVSDGFEQGVDYRDNATGTINDDSHYAASGVTVGSESVVARIGFTGLTTSQRLIAIRLDIDTDNVGTGAMVGLYSTNGSELDFMHVDANRQVQILSTPGDDSVDSLTPLQNSLGNITLAADAEHWIGLQIAPREGTADYRLIPVVVSIQDGTGSITTIECNDISLNFLNVLNGVDPNLIGFSRSTNQIARVLEYKTISTSQYITHSSMVRLIRDHSDDKWCWGYARLIESQEDRNKVELANDVELQGRMLLNAGSTLDGGPIRRSWVNWAGATFDSFTWTVALPTGTTIGDYTFVSFEWHTGTDDTNASGNTDRRFSQMVAAPDIYDADGPNVIIGGIGRGADNYGLQVTTTTSSATVLTVEIININTTAGAGVPANSKITMGRFY